MAAQKDDYASWKEYRRHVGVKLLSEGWRQEDVATFLEVDQSTVCNWHKRSEADPEGQAYFRTTTRPDRGN